VQNENAPGVVVKNIGEPIRLKDVNLAGVSAESGSGGSEIKVWTRLALTSDDPFFHRAVDGLAGAIRRLAEQAGHHVNLGRADSVLLVVRPDQTAELWVDKAAVSILVLAKREIKAGSAVFEGDIADVTGMDFPCVNIGPKDKILYLFREDWRFGLFFDFNPEGDLDRQDVVTVLGTLYRRLKYRHLYDIIADQAVFSRLVGAGWFPFVEIIGADFKVIASHAEAGFDLADANANILQKFDEARLDRMFRRWMSKPVFKAKEAILASAVRAFKAQDPVAVIKIVLTEIEGLLADAYYERHGARVKLKQLLQFAQQSAETKSGAKDTLLLSEAFAKYLEGHTFANFDPAVDVGEASSRHAVGHGVAKAESYTQERALQALLTLDQFAFYI
jgi:hypothetical protein